VLITFDKGDDGDGIKSFILERFCGAAHVTRVPQRTKYLKRFIRFRYKL
jgi:hypothetical protein